MALLVVARNAVLFLVGWEGMALAAYFAVTADDRAPAVRDAGYLYLLATRLGTLCLMAMFALLEAAGGSFAWVAPSPGSGLATAIFALGLAGFGLKAGLVPLHVWLPGAHANAPSHVSAVMSGVLIKMGIYGVVRLVSLFPDAPLWWGGLVLGVGTASALLGVLFAIAQHDLKRLLAYHSVENIGIICMGLGLAMLGRSLGRPELVVLGLAGALLHVWNHGLFKALLFLSAGSVLHATGTREIDRLGGLLRRMPLTGLAFVVGAVAICGLPPLNGFVSELFVYLGLLHATAEVSDRTWLAAALVAPALALVGALAAACFVKVVGVAFLGESRSNEARAARESGALVVVPLAVLAGGCVLIGVAPALVAPLLDAAVRAFAPELAGVQPLAALAPLGSLTTAAVALLLLLAAGGAALALRTRRRVAPVVSTWDCGYAAPTARMQYSSSSFAQMLIGIFAWVLRPVRHAPASQGVFAQPASFHSEVPDVALDRVVLPLARSAGRTFGWLRRLQHGSVNLYVLYVVVTLVVLLLWGRGS